MRQARKNAVNLKFILDSENNENDVSTSSVKKNTRKRRQPEIDDDDVEEWANGIISYHNELNNSKNRSVTTSFDFLTSLFLLITESSG